MDLPTPVVLEAGVGDLTVAWSGSYNETLGVDVAEDRGTAEFHAAFTSEPISDPVRNVMRSLRVLSLASLTRYRVRLRGESTGRVGPSVMCLTRPLPPSVEGWGCRCSVQWAEPPPGATVKPVRAAPPGTRAYQF